jgi:hypothetical protein
MCIYACMHVYMYVYMYIYYINYSVSRDLSHSHPKFGHVSILGIHPRGFITATSSSLSCSVHDLFSASDGDDAHQKICFFWYNKMFWNPNFIYLLL